MSVKIKFDKRKLKQAVEQQATSTLTITLLSSIFSTPPFNMRYTA